MISEVAIAGIALSLVVDCCGVSSGEGFGTVHFWF
jgi:hypothetical protein